MKAILTIIALYIATGCSSESNPFAPVGTNNAVEQPEISAVEPIQDSPVVIINTPQDDTTTTEPLVTPTCEGSGVGWGWENNQSCIYEIEIVEMPETEPEAQILVDDEPLVISLNSEDEIPAALWSHWSGVWNCSDQHTGPIHSTIETKPDGTAFHSDSRQGTWHPSDAGLELIWDNGDLLDFRAVWTNQIAHETEIEYLWCYR